MEQDEHDEVDNTAAVPEPEPETETTEETGEEQEEEVIHSQEDLKEFEKIFKNFDRDQSETMDPTELGDALRFVGSNPTEAEVEKIIHEAEEKVNEDGKLNFTEFCAVIAKHRKNREEEEDELRKAFRVFDKNGDKKIDREELKQTMDSTGLFGSMSEKELDDLMDTADTNGDGKIDYDELVRVIMGGCAE